MANVLSKSNIANSNTIEAWQVSQSVDAFTGIVDYDITISGSLTVTGSTRSTSFTGSLLGTASYASRALSSSYAITASHALNSISASYASSSTSASYATTASYLINAASKVSGEFISTGTTTGVPGDLKIAAGFGSIAAGNTFVDLTFNTLTTKTLGLDCFVSVGISSSYTTGSMVHFPRVDSLTTGVLRFSIQSSNASVATPFFYTIIYT